MFLVRRSPHFFFQVKTIRKDLQEYERRQREIIEWLDVSPKDIAIILEKHRKDLESLKKRKLELKLQIEYGLGKKDEDSYEQRRLASRINGVNVSFAYEQDAIESLKGLLQAISGSLE